MKLVLRDFHDIRKTSHIMEINQIITPYGTWSQNRAPFFITIVPQRLEVHHEQH